MQLPRASRAAHAADIDWGMRAFKAVLVALTTWFTIAFAAYYFVGYSGLVTVARPITIVGEWLAGMNLLHPGLLYAVTISAVCLIAVAMITVAVKHELSRLRAERSHIAKHAQRTTEIDSKVAAAATELGDVDDVVHYITSMPFPQ